MGWDDSVGACVRAGMGLRFLPIDSSARLCARHCTQPIAVIVMAGTVQVVLVSRGTLVKDILTFPVLADAELALMDIDPERLEYSKLAWASACCQQEGNYPARVTARRLDRRQALAGADAVLVTILAGSTQVWRHDIEIPKKFGVDTNVGDTRGPSGIFRALRTIPVMVEHPARTWKSSARTPSCSTTPTRWR